MTGTVRSTSGGKLRSSELATWRALLETTTELRRILGAQLHETDIAAGEYSVLLALSEAPSRRLRSSDLATTIDWERSRLSHQLGRMEKRGLVRREECATDNRGAFVVITDEGTSALRRASGPHLRAIKRLFADAFSDEQLLALSGTLTVLREHLDQLTEPQVRS